LPVNCRVFYDDPLHGTLDYVCGLRVFKARHADEGSK
jgi:hypothetical protein